ncbi:DUF2062 domain-containing protein [Hartmannibacter diazotrophicus]|uniref:DUF2062 domain-containing protein n=1 Tax=Hartmannibacter diazotrophicus TaxID=1482074 RepID=UPI001FE5B27D|nr:DUF2062 domain-containing protein [Hartmannibacter diazotrophicus]
MAYFRKRIVRLKATPHAVAAGVAAGAFSSFTPFIGFHFLLGFGVAYLFRGSMIAAALGTAIGNPLTFPFIWLSTFEVGRFVLSLLNVSSGDAEAPHAALFSKGLFNEGLSHLWPTLEPMIVGSIPLGLASAAIVYAIAFKMVATHQENRRQRRAEAQASMSAALKAQSVKDFGEAA